MISAWWLIPICFMVYCVAFTFGLLMGGDLIGNQRRKHRK